MQNAAIVGPGRSAINFDRASLLLMTQIRETENHAAKKFVFSSVLTTNFPQIDKHLVMAAIRAQNWSQLYLLGRMQVEKTPNVGVSQLLLKGIDILALIREAKFAANAEFGRRAVDEFLCDPYSMMIQAERVLDGEQTKPICPPGRRT